MESAYHWHTRGCSLVFRRLHCRAAFLSFSYLLSSHRVAEMLNGYFIIVLNGFYDQRSHILAMQFVSRKNEEPCWRQAMNQPTQSRHSDPDTQCMPWKIVIQNSEGNMRAIVAYRKPEHGTSVPRRRQSFTLFSFLCTSTILTRALFYLQVFINSAERCLQSLIPARSSRCLCVPPEERSVPHPL